MNTLSAPIKNKTEENKFITFQLGDYLFALPSQDVLKIIVTPTPKQGGMVNMGLVQLGQYNIQILELQSLLKLEKSAVNTSASDSTFLIIMQVAQTLWGIVVSQSPDLMNISNSALKPVPNSKRIAGALKGISHIVTNPALNEQSPINDSASSKDRQVLLVLDVRKLLTLSERQISETESDRPLTSKKANTKTAVGQ